jgi:hypothetical protein
MTAGTCRVCGCTDAQACTMPESGDPCWWVDESHELCSACSELLDDPLLEAIIAERIRQDAQWGGAEHDDGHDPDDWYDLLWSHVDRLVDHQGAAMPDYQARLIKIAAIALAAAQSADRTGGV